MAKGRHLSGARAAFGSRLSLAALALAALAATAPLGAFAQDAADAAIDAADAAPAGESLPAMASALPAEAPASLFSASLGGEGEADAELYVKGSWSAELLASLVFQKPEGGGLGLSSASPLLFTQDPDLFLSFLLFKKIFVEAKAAKDISQARFAAGYRGGEDETLKEARIGNDGISFPSLPFLSFGDGSYRSFGAAARVESGDFTGRAMLRYDQAERVVKKFVGGSEVAETEISPNAFISGKYFAAAAAPVANLRVFVQSAGGSLAGSDGNAYRELGAAEFSYSAAAGSIALKSAASTRVAIGYDSIAPAEPIDVGGVACDLAYEPPPETSDGSLDPRLQVLCRYPSEADPDKADAYVVDAATGLRDDGYSARIDPAGFVEVLRGGATILDDRGVYSRPFESAMAWLYTTDYSDPKALDYAPVFSKRIVVRSFSPSSSISIGKDAIAGSVEVRRNGAQDLAFSVDTEAGAVRLATPPAPSDEIEVTYMRESAERRAGMLSAALGGFWKLEEGWSAWAALGASWSVPGASYAAGGATSPGRISLAGGEKYDQGKLAHSAAAAASYSRDDATGRYRVEGMESSGSYASSFRPQAGSTAASGFSIAEAPEDELAGGFPELVRELHRDGSAQRALRIRAESAATIPPAAPAAFEKIVAAPPFESFATFSFLARIPSGATLSLRVDGGAASPIAAMIVTIVAGGPNPGSWTRFLVRYGSGDAAVYSQSGEGADLVPVAGATVSFNALARCSRLAFELSGTIGAGEDSWIDEVCLEDSVGRVSALFQGSFAYKDPELRLGAASLPLLSGIEARADALGGVSDRSFASGSASLKTAIGFLGLGLRVRARAAGDEAPAMGGGHDLTLPAVPFPVAASDSFDYDPATGSFGRSDSLALSAGKAASASFSQKTAWTPPVYILGDGLFAQEWSGRLSFAGSLVSIGLDAANRSLPAAGEGPPAAGGYFSSWIGSFAYALPAFEGSSERRSIAASLKASLPGGSSELATFTLGTIAEPRSPGGGYRRDSSSMRVGLPLALKSVSIAPYYSRSWKDRRDGSGAFLLDDAALALEDIAGLPAYFAGIPFAELASESASRDFAGQSAGIAQALLSAELGIALSREFGSRWYDLVVPSSLSAAFRRELSREDDSVTDTGVWEAAAKWAAVNLFGNLGAYPSGLPFDSDEYAGMAKASLSLPRGGSAAISIQTQQLATLYAGAADRLDLDNRFTITSRPDSGSWSEEIAISISRRVKRHFLLDLYRIAVPVPGADAAAPSARSPEIAEAGAEARSSKRVSTASKYLEGLSAMEPTARSIFSFSGGVDGASSDAAGTKLGWKASESYEARVTVPETLTLKASASLTQSLDAATGMLSLGFLISLGATISF